jgi:hypothetical protein
LDAWNTKTTLSLPVSVSAAITAVLGKGLS